METVKLTVVELIPPWVRWAETATSDCHKKTLVFEGGS